MEKIFSEIKNNQITAIRYKDNHILIYDPSIQKKPMPQQFFDLHEARWRGFDPKYILGFPQSSEFESRQAIDLFLEWQMTGDEQHIKDQAAKLFGIEETKLSPSSLAPSKASELESIDIEIKRIREEMQSILDDHIPPLRSNKQEAIDNNEINKSKLRKIQEFCQIRQIKQLVHFTHLRNLNNILEYGLLSRTDLESISDIDYSTNDEQRWDGCPDSISLSISFPNYKMFHRYKKDSPEEWVVITLSPNILWEHDCAFCRENAASNNVRFIPIEIRKQFNALEDLFLDYGQVKRSDSNIPDSFPTHPQAEVLVFNQIPPNYFMNIYFFDHQARDNWSKKNQYVTKDLLMVEREYFAPRCDYRFWQNQFIDLGDYS
jgi:hypothetical protein